MVFIYAVFGFLIGMGTGLFVSCGAAFAGDRSFAGWPAVILFGIIGAVIGGAIGAKQNDDVRKKELEKLNIFTSVSDEYERKYSSLISSLNEQEPTFHLNISANNIGLLNTRHYIFIANNTLRLFPTKPTKENATEYDHISVTRIQIDNIDNYETVGEKYRELVISGGGGKTGGVDVGGAVLGGLLFGAAGAIIGSRKENEIEAVRSQTVERDDRRVVITLTNPEESYIICEHDDLKSLQKYLPQKDAAVIQQVQRDRAVADERGKSATLNIAAQISELKRLRDDGTLSEEEFITAKKKILD